MPTIRNRIVKRTFSYPISVDNNKPTFIHIFTLICTFPIFTTFINSLFTEININAIKKCLHSITTSVLNFDAYKIIYNLDEPRNREIRNL